MKTDGHIFNGELDPAKTFHSHAKNRVRTRKQYDGLTRIAEGLRTIGAQITSTRCNGTLAHAMLDDLIRMSQMGQVRFADIHNRDIGATHKLAHAADSAGISTIGHLATSNPTKLMAQLDLLDALGLSIAALRRLVDLDQESRSA